MTQQLYWYKTKNSVHFAFSMYLCGLFLRASSITALVNLQTSVNVEDGLGATTMWIAFLSSMFFGMFLGPILIYFFGYKVSSISGNIGLLGYVFANFYPRYFTLIPGAICFGYGRALGWTCAGAFIATYATEYHRFGKKCFAEYFSIVNALHFCSIQSCQIVGNLIIFAIFSIDVAEVPLVNNVTTTAFETTLQTFTQTSKKRWSTSDICGANDCQNPDITNENLSNYKPASEGIRYIAMGVLAGLVLLGIILHMIFLPNISDEPRQAKAHTMKAVSNKAFTNDEATQEVTNKEKEIPCSICEEEKVNPANENESKKRVLKNVVYQIQSTLKQFLKPQQLLLTGFQLQAGLSYAFVTSEITRAFVSCVYGVAMIGVCMCAFGASSFTSSILVGKLSGKLGRKYMVGVGYFAACGLYLFCLYWMPTKDSSIGAAIGLLLLSGFVDACCRTLSSEVTLAHFLDDKKQAYVCWFVWMTVGMLTQFAWSTSICVRQKLYIMVFTLSFAVATYGVAEYLYEKRTKKHKANTAKTSINKC